MSEVVQQAKSGLLSGKLRVLLLPVTAISMVFVMLIPLPSFVLDVLLAASMTASVIVFLTAVQIRRRWISLFFLHCFCCLHSFGCR